MASSTPSSLSPPEVPMELHARNREKLVRALRDHLAASSRPIRGFVLLQDIASGNALLFAPRLPADYAVWLGEIKPLSYFKERYLVDLVFYVDEMVQVLHDHSGDLGKPLLFLLTKEPIFQMHVHLLRFKFCIALMYVLLRTNNMEMEKFETDVSTLHPILTECRVFKSEMELALIQYANDVSSEAHIEESNATKMKEPFGEVGERIFGILFTGLYVGYEKCKGRHERISVGKHLSSSHVHVWRLQALLIYMYMCYCSVLHYGHSAAPNDRTLKDGDMALFDMGAEYHFYGSDITCSFPVNGKFTKEQIVVYSAVLNAHNAVIMSMRPGVNWIDMHKLAEKTILESLAREGILLGDIEDMMAVRLGAVFMAHGLGHFLGIDTHDPGGYAQGMERPIEPGLRALRTIRTLQEGMVSNYFTFKIIIIHEFGSMLLMFAGIFGCPAIFLPKVIWLSSMVITVEPGCYFIDALLVPAMEDPVSSKFFNCKELGRYRNFGGVRIESDVYVTAEGCKNLTNVPREVWEIEAVMAGAPWPINGSSIKSHRENDPS
ncbi:xaa-Pro dipeptidase [Cocos nucifera]|uniref:Xaa-Pro dipeptidase n=1 Tax=Cocos nucifera TaxID=13894 RepID=A0A8K0HYG5_COCNU|nr:xaa-Pro dipeptidase [Cocos nucifera]